MAKVKLLEKLVCEQIAAGEVIESPLSVVKELVENALDAQAKRIEIILETGGKKLIRVTDDGWGLSPQDAELALKRFATSKITKLDDLERIATLGFRGEALPSMAAVSRLILISREAEAIEGIKIEICGGEIKQKTPLGCPAGTIIEVSELFYNTPARKKFLRSPGWEAAKIINWLGRMALYYQEIDFRLLHNQKEVLAFPARADQRQRFSLLLGLEAESLLPLQAEGAIGKVSGLAGKPQVSLSNREGQVVFLNGRLIKNPLIFQAVAEGFGALMEKGKYPVFLLLLELSGEQFDVNVHPTKAEVRFASGKEVFALVSSAVRQTLQAYPAKVPDYEMERSKLSLADPALSRAYLLKPLPAYSGYSAPLTQPALKLEAQADEFIPLGQVDKTYLVGIYQGELYLIDQHAAAERIAYEKLKAGGRGGGELSSQALLFPEIIELTPAQLELVLENLETFKQAGLELELFGEKTVLLRTVPAELAGFEARQSFIEVLDELLTDLAGRKASLKDQLFISLACKGSLKAGANLSLLEMNKLFNQLILQPDYSHCPHGRPTLIKMGKKELEKLFKR